MSTDASNTTISIWYWGLARVSGKGSSRRARTALLGYPTVAGMDQRGLFTEPLLCLIPITTSLKSVGKHAIGASRPCWQKWPQPETAIVTVWHNVANSEPYGSEGQIYGHHRRLLLLNPAAPADALHDTARTRHQNLDSSLENC